MQREAHFHRRNLPHIYIPNSTYFITFRLKGSIPQNKLSELIAWRNNLKQPENKENKYKLDKLFFGKYDKLLHESHSIQYLNNDKVANIIAEQIHIYDEKEYNLICYSIMSNHVHMVISLLENSKSIDKIMQTIK